MNRYSLTLSLLGIFAIFLLIYIIPLGERPLVIPDEPRYAEIPREMLSTGDWIVPRFNGLRYFEKPVLAYWPIAASIVLFGENAFATRLPSALSTGIMALIIFLLLKRFGRDNREGLLAALAFLTCVEIFAVGTTNILDSTFTMFITATMASFFYATQTTRAGKRRMGQVLGGVLVGLAFLTKGFIAFAIPVTVLIPYLFWNRRGREVFTRYWIAMAAAILVALPWSVALYLREPNFWTSFIWDEHIQRFFGTRAQHAEPFWYFFTVLVWGVFPWVILLPASIYGLVKTRLRDPLIRFSLCWFIFPFLFFSFSRGKLPTYILPCFPPLMILLVRGLFEFFRAGGKKIFNTAVWILIGIFLLLSVGLVVVQTAGFPVRRFFSLLETWKWIAIVDGLFVWSLFLLLAVRQKDFLKKIILFGVAPVVLIFSSHFLYPDMAKYGKAPGDFFLLHASEIEAAPILISDNYSTGALCWFSRRNDIYLLESYGEFGYGLNSPEAQDRRVIFERFRKIVENISRRKRILLVLDTDRYLEYQPHLPPPRSVTIGDGFVLAEF